MFQKEVYSPDMTQTSSVCTITSIQGCFETSWILIKSLKAREQATKTWDYFVNSEVILVLINEQFIECQGMPTQLCERKQGHVRPTLSHIKQRMM